MTCPNCGEKVYSAHTDAQDCADALKSLLRIERIKSERLSASNESWRRRHESDKVKLAVARGRIKQLERGQTSEARFTRLQRRIAEIERRVSAA